jgi:hypothetical protein
VIAERQDVGACGQEPVREPRGDACAVGDILAVDDAEAGAELLLQPGQPLLDSSPPGRAEDVGDEEELQL